MPKLMKKEKAPRLRKPAPRNSWKHDLTHNWTVYALFAPIFVYVLVLSYIPMFGIIMAFERYSVTKGYFGSPWVGWQNFIDLFSDSQFLVAIRNTLCISGLSCTIGFVAPIVFALLLTTLRSKKYKRIVQTFSYMPNFVAAVIVANLLIQFLGYNGPLTLLLCDLFGLENQNWIANNQPPIFWFILLFKGIWQGVGWGSIIYVAAISTVSGDLHEAAAIDGATRFQRITRITLPCILPTIIMMFVMQMGTLLSAGTDNLLLYMPSTYNVADTVYTYTYRFAFSAARNYGLSAASGLFQSVIGTILLVGSNSLSRKLGSSSLF